MISPHGWMDPGNWPRLWKLGGVAFPGHSKATDYVKEYRQYRPKQTPFLLGWGYGADLGGLSHQPAAGTVKYPFKSYDGKVTLHQPKTGERTWDYTKEGVAQYGLYAEWFDELRRLGGRDLERDMTNGSEAYLQMWERAEGIRAAELPPSARARARARPRAADPAPRLDQAAAPRRPAPAARPRVDLLRARQAQPDQGRLRGAHHDGQGRAGGQHRPRPPRRPDLRGQQGREGAQVSRSIGRGLYVRRAGKRSRFVYYVRKGRVRMVAVATRKLASSRRRLRAAVRRSRRARAAPSARSCPRARPAPR